MSRSTARVASVIFSGCCGRRVIWFVAGFHRLLFQGEGLMDTKRSAQRTTILAKENSRDWIKCAIFIDSRAWRANIETHQVATDIARQTKTPGGKTGDELAGAREKKPISKRALKPRIRINQHNRIFGQCFVLLKHT